MRNKIVYLAFSVLVIAFALIGCGGGSGGGTASPVGPAVTAGAVADLTGVVSFSGQPLSEAAVYLYSSDKALQAGVSNLPSLRGVVLAQTRLADGSYFTKTDATGRYSFSGIPVGEYTLIAVKDEAHQFAQTGVLLGSVTTADAQLTPTGKVSGKVQLTTGQAVAGAIVHLEKTSYVAISDVNGDFVINHVPAGQNFNLGVVSTMGTLSNTVPVVLTPAEEKSLGVISLAVPTQQLANITGSITTTDSAVPASALAGRIVIVTSADPSPLVAMSDSAGNFSLAVKAVGNYNISVVGGEYAVSPNMQTINVAALSSTVSLPQPFVMSKPAVVMPPTTQYFAFSGTVNKRSMAFNEPDQAGVTLTLTAQDGSGKIYSAVTSPTGAFTFNVPAGNFNFAVGGGYAFETTFTNPVAITANTALTATVWVVPTQVFATSYLVEGSLSKETLINNETDNSNVIVTLTPTTGAAVTYAGATGGTGNFAIRVPAGTYNMAITGAYRFKTAFTNPVAVSANVNVGTGILLVPAIAPVQNFLVTGTAQKTVFVNGEATHVGVTIALTSTSGAAQTFTGMTDTAGAFSISVPAGNYSLSVISSSYKPGSGAPTTFSVSADYPLGTFNVVPAAPPTQLFTLGGTALKSLFVDGETNHANLTIALTPTSGSGNTYSAVTTNVGSFSMQIPAGSYNLSVISSLYKPAAALPNPVNVSGNMVLTSFNLNPITAPVAMFTVGGTALKSLFVDGETNHSNVTIALTPTSGSGNTYSAVTANVGSFSMQVPAGNYNLSVISSLYKPAAALPNPVTVSGNMVLTSFNLNPITAPVAMFTVGGTALKSLFVDGETNHSNVTIALTPTSGSGNTYSAVTTNVGSFSMQVPAGSYNLSVISSLYKPAAALPNPVVISDNLVLTGFNLNPINPTFTQYFVEGWLNKSVLIEGDSGNGGVVVTLTSTSAMPTTYNTVTDASGYFKLIVAPDYYNLGVGGGYKLDAAVVLSPFDVTSSDQTVNSAASPLNIVPLSEKLFSLPGSISKFYKKPGDFDDGGVAITLRSGDPMVAPQVAITDSLGNFVFKAASGTYTIEIGSGYTYDADYGGIPVSVVLPDDTSVMTIIIVPDTTQLGIVRGAVSPVTSDSCTVRLKEVSPGTFVDMETTAPGNGQFAFYNVPAGNYTVTVMPGGNGFYSYSGVFALGAGEDVAVVMPTTDLKPFVSTVSVSETLLDLSGGNFESLPADPSTTRMFVDGIRRFRASGYTSYSASTDQCVITSVAPGSHTLVIEKAWTSADTAEVFVVRSEPYTFVKPIGQPNVFIDDIGSNYAAISWENQKFTQDSIVEVLLAGTVVASYIVTGNSFEIPDLAPETLYSIYVYNRYGDQRSLPGAQIVTTHAVANYGISNRVFAGSGLLTHPIFGFEVINGISYVARYNSTTGGGLYVHAYNPDGTASATSYFRNIEGLGSPSSFSFCSDGSYLYLIYTHPTDQTTYIDRINPTNLDIAAAVQSAVNVGTAGWFDHNDLLFAGGKLFNIGTRYTGTQHRTVFELFTAPTTDLSLATIISTDDQANPTSIPTAKLCADNSFVYRCRLADGTGNNLVVEKFPLTVTAPAAPVLVTRINGNMPVAALEFAAGRGELYLKASFSTPTYDYSIDSVKGSFVKRDGMNRGNYAIDGRGRIWMGSNNTTPSFIQVSGEKIIELPVPSFPGGMMYPSPAEFLKLDPITGSFNMLYKSGNGDLSLFFYSSAY